MLDLSPFSYVPILETGWLAQGALETEAAPQAPKMFLRYARYIRGRAVGLSVYSMVLGRIGISHYAFFNGLFVT